MMLQEGFFNTGDVSLNYAEGQPSGLPLVMLHGIPGRWQEFLPVIPALSMRWHIYALDLRGHGKSERAPGKYRPEHYTADVKAFLQSQLDGPAVLFGNSAGGLAALAATAQAPEQVRALVIGDSPIDIQALVAWMSTDEFTTLFTALRELAGSGHSLIDLARALGDLHVPVPGSDPPLLYRELPGMNGACLRAWAQTMHQLDPGVLEYHAEGRSQEYLADFDMDAILQKVSCPTLLVRGNPGLGALLPAEAADHAISVLPDAIQVTLEEAGHDLGMSNWEVAPLLQAITDFLESL